MSTPIPVLGPSEKRKHPLAGNQDKREELDRPDPEDLNSVPSSAPALCVPKHGQGFSATMKNITLGQHPNSAVLGDMQENQRSATSATAKSILYKIKQSPNTYHPLKPIAEHLWYILDKCKVWPPSPTSNPQPYSCYSEQR